MNSKIIKGGQKVSESSSRQDVVNSYPEEGAVVHKRVLDAREKANEIIAAAEAGASQIRDEARKVLEQAKLDRDASIKKGYAEGESKGLAQVTEKLMRLEETKTRFYESIEPEVIKLVLLIAEKVIGRMASENPDLIKSVVHQALEHALGDRITVNLNPEDHKALMSGDHEFKDVVDRTKRLMFRADESIERGGCVVETEVGTIDARLETQLKAIRKALEIA